MPDLETARSRSTPATALLPLLRHEIDRRARSWTRELAAPAAALIGFLASIEDEDSIVLTLKEYDALRTDRAYRRVIEYLTIDHTLLFIGYGMSDPYDLDIILSATVSELKGASSRHFALLQRLPDAQAELDRRQRLRDEYRVQVIAYDDHAEVARFLESLAMA